jgi:hypothetical protein
MPVQPFSPDCSVGGSVYVFGPPPLIQSSESFAFQIHQFTVSVKDLAEWFGPEIARLVVDECFAARGN